MMKFGEVRSRIHNGDRISWEEIEELSLRDDYEEVIKPYLAAFPDYWKEKFITIHGREELEKFESIAPFVIHTVSSYYETESDHFDFSQEVFTLVRGLYLYGMPYRNNNVAVLARSPHLSKLTELKITYQIYKIPEEDRVLRNGVLEVFSSPNLSNLTYLAIVGIRWDETFAREVAESIKLSKLDKLRIKPQFKSSISRAKLIQILKENPQLENTEILTSHYG